MGLFVAHPDYFSHPFLKDEINFLLMRNIYNMCS